MRRYSILFYIILLILIPIIFIGCVASPRHPKFEEKDDDNNKPKDTVSTQYNEDLSNEPVSGKGNLIIKTALIEREKEMYSPSADTTYLYWLNNKPIFLRNSTKCNIFALNTLFKAGYKTPKTNALSRDLFNEELFQDFMPIIDIKNLNEILTGDLVVWKNHVIIFEELVFIKDDPYAKGVWAGTSKSDNGKTVKNNVMYGKYPLKGNFVVRRPQKSGK